MNSGKKTKYINSNNHLSSIDDTNFTYNKVYTELPDTIRYFSRNFWTTSDNNLVDAKNVSSNVMFEVRKYDENTIELVANKTKFTSDTINDRGILERKFNKSLWEQYLNFVVPNSNTLFEDFNILFPEPKNFSEEKDIKASGLNFISREFIYNFYSKKYESLLKDRRLDVTTLPNVFALINDPRIGTRTYEENLVLTLGGLIPDNYMESLFLAREESDLLHDYFDKYSEIYVEPDAAAVVANLANIYSNVKIDKNKISYLKKANYIPFPFYLKAVFSNIANKKNNFIHEMQKIGGLADDLLNYLLYQPTPAQIQNFLYSSDNLEQVDINYYSLKDWINRGLAGEISYPQSDDPQYVDRVTKTIPSVEYTSLIEYIKNNLKNKKRSYEDFMNKECVFEPLFYKIEKRMFNYDRANVIQTFWITPDDGELINFIDSQIKYSTEYYYTISCYGMALGNEYSYKNYDYSNHEELRLKDISDGIYKVNVTNSASYKIFEIPFARFNGVVHEPPYTKPILKIEKDNNYIRFNIKQSAEQSLEEFEIVENNDFQLFESIRLSQDNEDAGKIRSTINKSHTSELEIYRTTNKPVNYLTFQGKLYKTVLLENTNSFIDSIVPEIKYYYMFRYRNKHGTPSNASEVYELHLKDEDGYKYLNVKTLDLNMGMQKSISKDLKRYLLIRPSIIQQEQKIVEKIATVDDIILGPDAQKAWNKKFILRITSKKTNRVIELNINPTIKRQKD